MQKKLKKCKYFEIREVLQMHFIYLPAVNDGDFLI